MKRPLSFSRGYQNFKNTSPFGSWKYLLISIPGLMNQGMSITWSFCLQFLTYSFQTDHLVGKLKDFCAVQKNVGIEIWYNGGSRRDMEHWMIERRTSEAALMLQEQPKGGLGLKLQLAAKQSLSQGRDYVVIIGRRFKWIHFQFLTELTNHFWPGLYFQIALRDGFDAVIKS